jgi:hypothetical protein
MRFLRAKTAGVRPAGDRRRSLDRCVAVDSQSGHTQRVTVHVRQPVIKLDRQFVAQSLSTWRLAGTPLPFGSEALRSPGLTISGSCTAPAANHTSRNRRPLLCRPANQSTGRFTETVRGIEQIPCPRGVPQPWPSRERIRPGVIQIATIPRGTASACADQNSPLSVSAQHYRSAQPHPLG